MAPGIAALAGAGGVAMYQAFRERSAARWGWVLPASVAGSAVWAVVLLRRASGSGTIYTVAEVVVGAGAAIAVIGLLVGRFTERQRLMGVAALAAVVALLAGPAAYSVSAATSQTNGTNPTAGPSTGGMGGGMGGGGARTGGSAPTGTAPSGTMPSGTKPSGAASSGTASSGAASADGSASGPTGGGGMGGGTEVSTAMINYLKQHQDGATWLVAVATDQTASSIILQSGEPVISMGGWSGSDNAMTLAKLKTLVAEGKLHYIVISTSGGQGTNSEIAAWVKAHGTAVKASAYDGTSTTSSTSSGLYRLDASDVS
jgi:4-amino-4-deoxy-L-arabinose transferase-like glycosyltransferase